MKKTILSALSVTSFAFAASAGSFMWQAALGFSPSEGNLDFASTWRVPMFMRILSRLRLPLTSQTLRPRGPLVIRMQLAFMAVR